MRCNEGLPPTIASDVDGRLSRVTQIDIPPSIASSAPVAKLA